MDVLNVDRLVSVIQRRCESHSVSLTWSQSAITASTDGSNIILPLIHSPVTPDAMTKLHGFVVHECGHHARPDVFKIVRALPKDTPQELFALFNIMEDDGMEREVAGAHLGDAIALGKQNNVILKELSESFAEKDIPEDITEQQVAPLSACGLGQLSRLEWDGMSGSSRAAFFDAIPPVARKLVNDLTTEGYVDRMQATKDPHDCWDLAVDLYKRIFPDNDQDEAEELRQKGHEMVPDDGQDGDKEEGEGQAKAQGGGEEGDEEGEGGTPAAGEGAVISWKDAVLSSHNEWKAKEDGEPPGNIGIDWADYQSGSVCLMPQNEINVCYMKEARYKPESRNDWNGVGKPATFMSDNAGAATFGNQIRRYIQAKAKTRVKREQLHGRIDKSSLVKLAMPPIDGGEWNKKIFYNFSDKQELDTCIMVLTDWSGSMSGQKMVQAADCSGRLVQVFDRILKVPVQLAAFSDGDSPCDIGVIKEFSERSISPEKIAERFSKFYRFSSANNDADALLWAYNQIKVRKEKRKLLIVLSDGCPAGSYAYTSSHANLKHVAKGIESAGQVELYGVGIQSDAVESYYTNVKVLSDPSEINKVLFEIIKEGVK